MKTEITWSIFSVNRLHNNAVNSPRNAFVVTLLLKNKGTNDIFCRMTQKRGFPQRNYCGALANLENAFPRDSFSVQQSFSDAKK